MRDTARDYLDAGLCVLPARRDQKRPVVAWKAFQRKLPTAHEVAAWFANGPDALCVLTGEVSGRLELIDFDNRGELFDAWRTSVETASPGLTDRLVIAGTQSGGRHAIYRCSTPICGNLKLAQRKRPVNEAEITRNGKGQEIATIGGKGYPVQAGPDGAKHILITLIETRGEGGLFLTAPTKGYEILQGDLCDPPVLSEDERDVLLRCAWALNECPPPVVDGSHMSAHGSNSGPLSADISNSVGPSADPSHMPADSSDIRPLSADNSHIVAPSLHNSDKPGDEFNRRGDVRTVLRDHGWTCIKGGDNEYWRRPGKDRGGHSATLKDGVFYVFTSNATPFEPMRHYSPFAVYAMLEHQGDYPRAARELRQLGYGGAHGEHVDHGVDLSAIVGGVCYMSADSGDGSPEHSDIEPPVLHNLRTLIDTFEGLNAPVIHGVLREGETMNVIASPKVGKSWFVSRLALSVASGIDWLGFPVEQGRVLHIDNELHINTSAYRYRVISEAADIPHHLYSGHIDLVSLRGCLRDLHSLGRMFARLEPGHYRTIVIDAFYRTLPRDTDENDNGAIAGLYNLIDSYAMRLGCAFVLIHHASKGNQSGKAVTDVGAGAGSQSRAADTHMILRPHEADDLIVLESAMRSWPPLEPLALHWRWPLFTPANDVDTSALAGMAKPKAKSKSVPIEQFVEECIATHDPCSQRSVRYEAAQQFELSERQANDTLDLAIERGLAARIRAGSQMRYVKVRGSLTGDGALWTAALLAHEPDMNPKEIGEMVGVSERYVRQIRAELERN